MLKHFNCVFVLILLCSQSNGMETYTVMCGDPLASNVCQTGPKEYDSYDDQKNEPQEFNLYDALSDRGLNTDQVVTILMQGVSAQHAQRLKEQQRWISNTPIGNPDSSISVTSIAAQEQLALEAIAAFAQTPRTKAEIDALIQAARK